jgi:hypothetical protein
MKLNHSLKASEGVNLYYIKDLGHCDLCHPLFTVAISMELEFYILKKNCHNFSSAGYHTFSVG